jgi:hypothetical protein
MRDKRCFAGVWTNAASFCNLVETCAALRVAELRLPEDGRLHPPKDSTSALARLPRSPCDASCLNWIDLE